MTCLFAPSLDERNRTLMFLFKFLISLVKRRHPCLREFNVKDHQIDRVGD